MSTGITSLNFEKQIQQLAQTMGNVFYKLNFGEMNYEYMSPTIADLCGYTKEELNEIKFASIIKKIETSESEFVEPETIKRQWRENLVFEYNKDCLIKTKSGELIYINDKSIPVKDRNNNIIGSIGILSDIHERKLSEKIQKLLFKISQSVNTTESVDELLEKIYEIISEEIEINSFSIAINDNDNSFLTFAVENGKKIILSKNIELICNFLIDRQKETILNLNTYYEILEQIKKELNLEMPKFWLSIPIKLNNYNGVLSIYDNNSNGRSITKESYFLSKISQQVSFSIDKKIQDESFVKNSEELKQQNANKDKFFSIIAHDLRSPFTGLLGFSEILANELDMLSKEEAKKYVENIKTLTRNLFKMINDLLNWSRIQIGKMEFKTTQLDLLEEILYVKNIIQSKANKKEIKIQNKVIDEIQIYSDQNVVRYVLENLIYNAIKFSYRKNEIIIECEEKSNEVILSVTDFGVGINSEDLNNLFKIEKQLTTPGTEDEKGTGLGLIICNEMLSRNKNRIWAESKKDSSNRCKTTFSFTLSKNHK